VSEIGVLILDDNADSCQALHHLLDSEGWRVHFVTDFREALTALASGNWNLVIANVELATPGSQLFTILRDLAHAEGVTVASEAEGSARNQQKKTGAKAPQKKRLRVLFVAPANLAHEVVPDLEREELPYSLRPYHLHDFFEKITDLLAEAGAIARPTGDSRFDTSSRQRNRFENKAKVSNAPSMFASRSDYQMTEEEISEYERQEEEDRQKKSKKPDDYGNW
jgi:CheY-like chemotaxis protein